MRSYHLRWDLVFLRLAEYGVEDVRQLVDRMAGEETDQCGLVLERNEDTLSRVRRELDETAFDAAWEQGRRLTADQAAAVARAAIASGDSS